MKVAALRADEIVLATTQASWQQSSIDAMCEAIVGHYWPAGRGPVLRLVTGLGEVPAHQVIDPDDPEPADVDVAAKE